MRRWLPALLAVAYLTTRFALADLDSHVGADSCTDCDTTDPAGVHICATCSDETPCGTPGQHHHHQDHSNHTHCFVCQLIQGVQIGDAPSLLVMPEIVGSADAPTTSEQIPLFAAAASCRDPPNV